MSLQRENPASGRLSGLRRTAAMVTSAVISGAWVTLAAAQDHAAAAGGPPDQIDVLGQRQDAYRVGQTSTATKTLTPLLDIPQSITMVTRDLIRDQAMQSMGDVVRYVPGVQMAQGEGHRDAPILRGNTSTADFFINGMRDDVQYYRDLYNVERVEVLKGPSGMIFGRGGIGRLDQPRAAASRLGRSAASSGITLGSWQNRRITGDYGQAISDSAAFRVTALYEDSESYRDYGELTRRAINPTVAFRPSDTTTLTFGYERIEDDRVTDRGIPSQLPLEGAPLDIDGATFFGAPELSPNWADVDALSSILTHDFGDRVHLTNQTRYAEYDKFYQNVFPGAYTAATGRVEISGYNNLTARQNFLNRTDVTLSARTGAVTHTLLAGLEIARQETDNFRETGTFQPSARRLRWTL